MQKVVLILIQYIVPCIAIGLSILSFIDSRKANKIQERVSTLEEQLKRYELEEKQKEIENSQLACIEARLYQVSKNNYRIKIWNSGKATAYNVDYEVQKSANKPVVTVFKDKTPFEFLESGKSFEDTLILYQLRKFTVTTTWEDKQGTLHSKEQIVSA